MDNLEIKKSSLKTFGLTNLSVDNKITVFIIILIIMLFGWSAYNNMPKESYPEISFPQIYVNTPYFGNSATDIENLITRPLEKEIAGISEVKELTSSSIQDFSIIIIEFSSDVDIDFAIRKVKDAVDKAKSDLPSDMTQDPEVIDINFSELPIMTVNLSGDYSNDALKMLAERMEDEIEDLKEISDVTIKGTQDKEVKIDVNLIQMQSRQVSFGDIENAIKSENLTLSGGEVVNKDFRSSIRIVGEVSTVKELEGIIIKSENQNPIYLKDIADVSFGFAERTSMARSDGLPVVSLDIIKRSGENLLSASDHIKEIVEAAEKNYLPDDIKVSIFNDQSKQTRDSVNNLENSIISGIILVTLVLLFFLGLRNATFVGVAIPLSMLMGFLGLSLLGYTLNMVLLFALILALGMLVDNGIVVVENIYRYRQNGFSADDSSKYGTGEVAVPIIASTATTLAAFVPLAFWPGLMGQFMKFLPITLIVVLVSSLIVALVINPVLTATFMKVDKKDEDVKVKRRRRNNILIILVLMLLLGIAAHLIGKLPIRNLIGFAFVITAANYFLLRPMAFFFQNRIVPWLEHVYDLFIRFALKGVMPYLLFFGSFALLILVMGLLANNPPKIDFFPVSDPQYVNAFVELPVGNDIEATNRISKQLEKKVEKAIAPYVKVVDAVLTQVGKNTGDPNSGPDFGSSPNKARLTVSFIPSDERGDISTMDAMDEIRKAVKGVPGVQVVVDQNANGPPQEKPILIEIKGNDINKLVTISNDMIAFINKTGIHGVEELKPDVKLGKPELEVDINRDMARRFELSTYQVADVIRTSIYGKEISKYKEGEDDFPIMLRASEDYRTDINKVLSQKITFRNPATGRIAQVPISSIADVHYNSTVTSINRKDQERMITITSNVLKGYNPTEVVNHIKAELDDYELPAGYSFKFGGQQEQIAEESAFLMKALAIGVVAIFLILVAQFNSILSPIIIILSVVFSLIGVLLGYLITGDDFIVVMSGVGVISLAGIVVNNAIVLIDYTNLLVQRKREELGYESMYQLSLNDVKEAIVAGGSTRLRPVLLTAITTILGLMPLAIGLNINFTTLITELDPHYFVGGDNADFWGPMAKTVIYGLVFATFLTLIVVPVMYWLFYRLQAFFKRGKRVSNNG